MMMGGSLVSLFGSLVVGSIGQEVLKRYAGFQGNDVTARLIAIAVSAVGLFVFLTSAYYVLTNVDLTLRDVLPGSITAAVLLEATFQVLPQYVLLSKHNPVLQTLSGPAVLLVWLYVMANVIVLGAEVNWWRANRPAASHLVARVRDGGLSRSSEPRCQAPAFALRRHVRMRCQAPEREADSRSVSSQARRCGPAARLRCQAPGFALRETRAGPARRAQLSCASTAATARARCEFARFQSSPSSATVRSSPAGMKTGS